MFIRSIYIYPFCTVDCYALKKCESEGFYQQVETALNNVRVLDEMLSRHQESPASQPDLDLMLELHSSCASLRANLYRLVSEMDDKDEGIGR